MNRIAAGSGESPPGPPVRFKGRSRNGAFGHGGLQVQSLKPFRVAIIVLLLVLVTGGVSAQTLREGDLIFHTSQSGQSKVIRLVTQSPLTHVGILVQGPSGLIVIEAVGPVKLTPLQQLIARGEGKKYLVKRLRGGLQAGQIENMRKVGSRFLGLPYDPLFQWDDQHLYCSELIWKVYQRGAGVRLGEPQRFSDLNLSSPQAQQLLRERLGPTRVDGGEFIVTPAALAACSRLVTVVNHF